MSGGNQPMQQQANMQPQQMQQQQQQQQQQQLSGRNGLFARPVAGHTLYEEVRTPQGIRYRPATFAQVASMRLRVV